MDYFDTPEQDDVFQDSAKKRKSARGRKLVRWNPDLDQLVLLAVDYVCTRDGVAIPWDEIGKVVESHLTGEAIKQHLVKIYKYREEDGHKVPPKLDRHQRRKATAAGGATAATPARAGRGKKAAATNDDEDDAEPQSAGPVKPGRTLLFKKPEPKSKRAPKKDAAAAPPKTPASGRGRKKAETEESEIVVKREDATDGESDRPKTKFTGARGSKRGRQPKKDAKWDGDEQLGFETRSKKPKVDSYLRAKPSVNYAEQMAQEDSEDESGDEITLKGTSMKNELPSSQGSGNSYSQPPPRFGLATPAAAEPYQSYPPAVTPGYDYSSGATTFDSSPINEYDAPPFTTFDHAPPPMMGGMPQGNDFHYGFNPLLPTHGNDGFNFNSNAAGYGSGGFQPTFHDEGVNAIHHMSHGGVMNPSHLHHSFGSTNNSDNHRDSYDHNNSIRNITEHDNRNNINGSISDTSADIPIVNATGGGIDSINPFGLRLDTGHGNFLPSQHITTSPTDYKNDGETGISPALAQTGFQQHNLAPADRNDSGIDVDYDPTHFDQQAFGDCDFSAHDAFLDLDGQYGY